jgi:hypothetical protein
MKDLRLNRYIPLRFSSFDTIIVKINSDPHLTSIDDFSNSIFVYNAERRRAYVLAP